MERKLTKQTTNQDMKISNYCIFSRTIIGFIFLLRRVYHFEFLSIILKRATDTNVDRKKLSAELDLQTFQHY